MKIFNSILITSLSFAFIACQSGNCRSNRTQSETENKQMDASIATGSQNKIRVFKYDGSKQCGEGQIISLSEMQKELAGVRVYSAENLSDGMIRTQVCGSPTGKANVYEIDDSSLEKAKAKGFKEWTFN